MSSTLSAKACIPCKAGTPPLEGAELDHLLLALGADWKVMEAHHLEKEYGFKDFRRALAFTNQVGELAEQENHHPDIYLSWGKVRLKIWSHKIDGLSESDFILAAKAEDIWETHWVNR